MVIFAKLLAILSSIILLLFLFSPRKLASIYYFIRPLSQPAANVGISLVGLPITSFYSLVVILSTVVNIARRGAHYIFVKHSIILYILILFSSLSFINSANYSISFSSIIKILTGLSFFLLIYSSIETSDDGLSLLKMISYSSLLPLFFGFYQYITGIVFISGSIGLKETDRINSFMGQANAYGIYLTLALIATLIVIFHEANKRKKIIFISILIMIVIAEILAKNRGTWIALLAGFTLSGIFYRKIIKLRWYIVILLAIAILFSNNIYNRFQELNELNAAGRVHNTFAGRVNYWKELTPLIMKHPLIGHGIGTSSLVTSRYLKTELAPHNDYLRLALEIGIPGSFLYFLFLFFELFRNIRLALKKSYWQVNYPILALAIYFLIISMTQNIINNLINFPLFTSLVAVSMRMNSISRSELSY